MNVMKAVNRLMLISARVAIPIRCINRWPAVILAVSRTASATGWINRLIVSVITSIGIRKVGVPWGKKWARDAFVLFRKPMMTVPAHRGTAIPIFIESCVVGVNECGSIPRRLVEAMNRISETSRRDQVCPLELCVIISCFDANLVNHCWIEIVRLLISRVGAGNKIVGNMMIRVMMGMPSITGVIKEVNRFWFMQCFRGSAVFVFW